MKRRRPMTNQAQPSDDIDALQTALPIKIQINEQRRTATALRKNDTNDQKKLELL